MYLFCISCKEIVATIKVPTLVLIDELNEKVFMILVSCGPVGTAKDFSVVDTLRSF